jgi:hypothetical protein
LKRELTKSAQVAHIWKLYYSRETHPDYSSRFWNCGTEITREEIRQAIDAKEFNPIESCGGHYQGNRAWHVRQIAGIVEALQRGEQLGAIWLNQDDNLEDGCHRLYAHWYLNREWIDVTYEQPK